MLPILLLLCSGIAVTAIYFYYKKRKQPQHLKAGDLAMLRHTYSNQFSSIPSNNVLHVLEVEDEFVKVEFINFKDGSYQQEKLSKQVIRKMSKYAA